LSVEAVHEILADVDVMFDDDRFVGVEGGVASEPALVVADADWDCAERFWAASYAATRYV
jgi:hypothetical protein